MNAARAAVGSAFVLVLALGAGRAVSDWRAEHLSTALAPGTPPTAAPTTDPKWAPRPSNVPTATDHPRWPARTVAEVTANIVNDAFASTFIVTPTNEPGYRVTREEATRVGVPVFVRSLDPSKDDKWLVPLVSFKDETVGVLVGGIRPDGTGNAGIYSSWGGPFPHSLSVAEAAARVSAAGDPVITAELVWAYVHPMASRGGFGDADYPFYRLVRQSGEEFFLFQNGHLAAARDVPIGN